jgi:hypothetical protein
MISSPIGRNFGLGIVEREFYDFDRNKTFPLEYSEDSRRNVIFLRNLDKLRSSIETAWTFREDHRRDMTMGCISKSWCASRCVNGCWPNGKHRTVHADKHGAAYEHKWDGLP